MDTPIERAEHLEFVHRMEDEHKRIHRRVDEVEKTVKQIHCLTTSVEKLALSVERMAQAQHEQAERIADLESRDGEKWRDVMRYLMTAGVGALLGFILTHLSL